jgi:hypothetical protein
VSYVTEKLNVSGLTDGENVTLNSLIVQLDQKSRRNGLRSSYYDGKRAVRAVGSIIPPQYANIGLALGWAAKGVDGLANRCNLDEMVWADGDLASLGMGELADSNFLFSEFSAGRTDSLIHGVSYLITTQGDESMGEPKALVHAKDALNATGDWNARTRRLDNLLSVTSRKDGKITGFVLYLNNLTISADKAGGVWAVDRSEHPWGVPVEPQVFNSRASRRMGSSRISRPVMGYQDAALRALIRLEAHMDIYTIPKMILLGASESAFSNADGTPKNSWQVALGRVFAIDDDDDKSNPRADVKQFSAESPAPHLSQLNALAKLMAREVDLSDSDFALTDMANPTSEGALGRADQTLISSAEQATDGWSVGVRRTVARALAIQNGLDEVPAGWASIVPRWRKPQYLSRAAQADAGAKQLGAVPWLAETTVGLRLLGLDSQEIDEALSQKSIAEARLRGNAVVASLRGPVPPIVPFASDAVGA